MEGVVGEAEIRMLSHYQHQVHNLSTEQNKHTNDKWQYNLPSRRLQERSEDHWLLHPHPHHHEVQLHKHKQSHNRQTARKISPPVSQISISTKQHKHHKSEHEPFVMALSSSVQRSCSRKTRTRSIAFGRSSQATETVR
jgi:hypothetical protein